MNYLLYFLALMQKMGYLGVTILMTIESSFIPLPSEIIIPPAAFLAEQGKMNIFLIILCGVLGSLFGALINYYIGFTLGRTLVYSLARQKWAKIFFIDEKQIAKVEEYFLRNANTSTFLGRLVPGVRHLISLPAGFCQMNIKHFIFYTVLGSSIWVTILALIGYYFGANKDLMTNLFQEISNIFLLIGIFFLLFVIYKIRKKRKNSIQQKS